MIFFGLRNEPHTVGLPSVEEIDKELSGKAGNEEPIEVESPELTKRIYKRSIKEMVLKNPVIWIISIADFFVYIIRFTILDWGSTILTQVKGMDITLAASVVGAMEIIGGILGMLLAGWVTDKFFKGRAVRTSAICTLLASLCMLAFWQVSGSVVMSSILIILSAFFIYGPQALLGIACSNQATKRAAATANGI